MPPKILLAAIGWTAGTLFGIAACRAITSSGIPLDEMTRHVPVSAFAQFRPALAWWTWMLLPAVAFALGRGSARLARYLAEQREQLVPLRLATAAGVILLLAWIAELPSSPAVAPPDALATMLFIGISALFAALGQRSMLGPTPRPATSREHRGTAPASGPGEDRGSIHPGLVPLEAWTALPAFPRAGRPALSFARIAVLALVTSLGASGGAVLVLGAPRMHHAPNHAATGALPDPSRQAPPVAQTQAVRSAEADRATAGPQQALARGSAEADRATAGPQQALARGSAEADRATAGPQQAMARAQSAGKPDERELTFANGYAAREAARAAANGTPTHARTHVRADTRPARPSSHERVKDKGSQIAQARRSHPASNIAAHRIAPLAVAPAVRSATTCGRCGELRSWNDDRRGEAEFR